MDFPDEYNVSVTFNVSDLSPFDLGDDSRTNPFQEKENDEGTTNKWNANPIQLPVGPIIRAQAKKFKETLNGLIQNIWVEVNLWRPKEDALHIPQGWISMIQALE